MENNKVVVNFPGCVFIGLVLTAIAGLLFLILLKLCGITLSGFFLNCAYILGGLVALSLLLWFVAWVQDTYRKRKWAEFIRTKKKLP